MTLPGLMEPFPVEYPKSPRPSFADQVLSLFRERDVKPQAVLEVRELQTALGLVAADSGICIVPASVERLRRDNVVYRRLDEPGAVSPIIMSARTISFSGAATQGQVVFGNAGRRLYFNGGDMWDFNGKVHTTGLVLSAGQAVYYEDSQAVWSIWESGHVRFSQVQQAAAA